MTMKAITRRGFLKMVGAGAAVATLPRISRAQGATARVVVVGGGFAGATVAKYLRYWGNNAVDVTLVDANRAHVSCILSNLVLNNSLSLNSITFNYDTLRSKYGVTPVQGQVAAIDTSARRVHLAGGTVLPYDRLVLAPGIAFDPVPGLDANLVPHAWQAGAQTTLLKNQLAAMPSGGRVVMTIPLAPYRCPPGPYERACLIADFLRRKKGTARIVVLDANPGIMAEKETFTRAFTQKYKGTLEYYSGVTLNSVDSPNRIARTSLGDFKAHVLNVIPRHRAGQIAAAAGVVNDAGGRWAGVDPLSYESTTVPFVHIIGDAQATGQPKAGHIANGEAKVCADAIIRLFRGENPDPQPVVNSACYSPITAKEASWLTAVFRYDPVTRTMKVVPASSGEAKEWNSGNFERMFDWAVNLFSDTFA